MQPDNEQLTTLLQTLPGAFFACDAQFHIWYCSKEALDLLQCNPLPSPATQCWDIFSKSEYSLLFPCYTSALTGEAQTITVFHKSIGRHLQHRCTPLPGGGLSVLLSEGTNTLISATSPNALSQYEERLSALTKTVSEVLYCMNADWSEIIHFSSNTFHQETVNPNNNWLETYIHPEDRVMMHAAVQEAIRSKTPFDLEHRVLRLDGPTVWTSSKAVPILDEDGDIVEWVGAATDITKRKELEGQLRQWADAFHHCAHGIAVGDITSNRIIVCNDRFASILGHAPEDLLGEPILSVYHPDIRKNVRRAIRKADRRGSYKYESTMLHRDGHGIPVQIDLVCICKKDGSLPYRIATMQDITHRKQMETALRSSEISALQKSAELEALIAAIPSPVFVSYDASCTNITGNAAAYEMTGIQPTVKNLSPLGELQEQLKLFEFRRDGTLLQPEDMTMMRAVSKKERITNDELQVTRPDGSIRWIYANAIPLFHENKEVWGCVCVCMDITRLKETTRALVENENKYRQLFELESDALALVDQQSLRIIDINSAFTNLYGYSRGELKNLLATDLSSQPEQSRLAIQSQSQGVLERLHCKKDGAEFPVEITHTSFDLLGQKVHLAAIRDVTERKLIEAKLHEKQDHLAEANAALRALLRQRELDRQDFEEAVEKNMKHFILPYLNYLKTSSLNPAQENWIDLLEMHLAQITSSFAHKLTLAELNFSNAELKVASLVREGKTSKEIAQQLMIAEKTVSAHRGNIRKKLGLKGKKGGLRYLLLNLR